MSYVTVEMRLSEHRDAIARLWAENMSDPRIAAVVPERLDWFYVKNPSGAPHTWLGVHSESEEVIGCASAFPRAMYVAGQVVRAGVLCDFAVARKHRVGGAAIAIQRALAQHSAPAGLSFLYGFPNKASAPICKRVGYVTLGGTSFWAKPLRSEYKLLQLAQSARVPASLQRYAPLAARGASRAVDRILEVGDLLRLLPKPLRFASEVVDRPDERFDALWARGKAAYVIVGERTRDYLDWRYAQFKTKKNLLFCLVERKGRRLVGYAVYTIQDNKAYVVDLFCEQPRVTFDGLMVHLAHHLRAEHCDSMYVSYFGDPFFEERFEALGFVRRPSTRPLVAYLDPSLSPELRAVLLDARSWFMFDGELDI